MDTTFYVAIAMAAIGLLNRVIPNEKTQGVVDGVCFKLGHLITITIGKVPVVGFVWNEVVEKWIVDLLNNIIGIGLPALKRGLHSDNPNNNK